MITWDETKRQANIEKHGLDFVGAEVIFDFPTVGVEDDREAYGEQRINVLGFLNGRIVRMTYTSETFFATDEAGQEEEEEEEIFRIISLRKADTHEANLYLQEIAP